MQQAIECSQELCSCTLMSPLESEAYCSDECRELSEDRRVEGAICPCGHPQCDTAP